MTKVYRPEGEQQEVLPALGELLKDIKTRNYSILNSPVKAEIFLAIILE
ncbi:MAG TPA: hypothetical protein PKA53_11570 [Sphingobacterium sp.]|nr:hypothetical protein [Sphingobacterium sp.]